MKCKIDKLSNEFTAKFVSNGGEGKYVVEINNKEMPLEIISINSDYVEFLLDQKYRRVRFVNITTASMTLDVDGSPITVLQNYNFDKIVYKNSGGSGTAVAKDDLTSSIPGKVVSINVKDGDDVKKGDSICTLESMKMQISIKSHRDGKVSNIGLKDGQSVAKGDVIATIK